ncbi:MAG: cyclase family protein [Melioribacteraceae bacterium]|nr:cyclase family protein [Melioribacteraceae bacterium]WKZ70362.1 MAG: cyclase family protein [Melioribacteraceae bacterium]
MKKLFITLFLLITTLFVTAQENRKIIDLTYAFDENTIFWPTQEGFQLIEDFHGMTEKGYFYSSYGFKTAEHGGTHLDAPIHFYEGRYTSDEIPLEKFIGQAIVIDASDECAENRDYLFGITDFEKWENEHGRIPDESIILLKSGYGKYWPDREKYMGTAERGEEAVAKLHFPGLSEEGAKWLVNERKIKAVGIDTPSIDYGQSKYFKAHVVLCEANTPIIENVANLDQLPPKGFEVIALPIKIKGGSGGPTRIIALISN